MQIDIQEKPKTFVVVNPVAGVSQPEQVREKIESALQAREIPFEIYETTGNDNFRQIIRNAIQQGFQLVIAAGGDGTLSGVVDGLVDTQIPLLILPTGTWNALAQALDIPLQIDAALELLFQEHRIRTIDAIEVNQSYYVLSVSAGVGARTMEGVKREEKRRFGRLADLRSAIVHALEFRSYNFEVKIDGKFTKFRASELMVANSSILGLKILRLDPDIRMDDGKLNVCRIYANSISEYLRLAASMLRGDQQHRWNLLCVEALQEVEIHCREKLPVQGDGELIGKLPVTVKIHPKAIQIVTPVDAEL
ncbi:MAG TPA: diacylglycerol kinase family protein [Anaerolineales bacterium]|nr:diacylglycerol kinase family protein [Anaerolineales bacterium]